MEDIVYTGNWWRFSDYEIRDGYIRPLPDAKLEEYSPLDDFQAARSTREEQRSPYEALVRIAERLYVDAAGELGKQSAADILDWCARYGLLGILLHQVQEVAFAPRWERRIRKELSSAEREEVRQLVYRLSESEDPTLQKVMEWVRRPSKEGDMLFVTQPFYQRTNYGSFVWGNRQTLARAIPMDRRKLGQVVSERLWPRAKPTVLLQRLLTGDWESQSIAESWGQFFPDVPGRERAVYQYPTPYSKDFWQGYAEPLHQFISGARAFARAFAAAASVKHARDLSTGSPQVAPTTSLLNALMPPVGSALLRMQDGSLEQRQISPSLLGSLVIMAQQDLASERRVIRCANDRCRLIVVASGYQTAYCSQQCRYAAQKRAQRASARERVTRGARARSITFK